MPLPFPFGGSSSYYRLPKRKYSGSIADLASLSASQCHVIVDCDNSAYDLVKSSPSASDTRLKISAGSTSGSWLWFCGVCRSVDLRELAGFVVWEALVVLVAVLSVSAWILFFRFVVAPDEPGLRAKYGAAWATFTALVLYARRCLHAQSSTCMRSLAEHAEIFVGVSLVMVFSTNIAFFLHKPSSEPLRDLGFMLVPAQDDHSPWRPLSDLMTALLPILFMFQSYLMTRENRCRVMTTFFRVATVCYALRTLTVSLTSLPGPAPHCRPGSALYLPPESWLDVVTRVGPMYGKFFSCGDLIFSGHMAYTNTAMLLYLRTLDRYFVRFSRLRWTAGGAYMFALAVLCISGRKHYTVDVVLGAMISTLVFFHFEHGWVPVCLQPPEDYALMLSRQLGGRRRGTSTASTVSGRSKSDMDLYEDEEEMVDPPLKRIVVIDADKDGGNPTIDFIC